MCDLTSVHSLATPGTSAVVAWRTRRPFALLRCPFPFCSTTNTAAGLHCALTQFLGEARTVKGSPVCAELVCTDSILMRM